MKRKLIAAAMALATAAGISIVSTPTANAYAYWRNGYFYADTSYSRNVPGVYVKIIGRRDVANQLYYVRVWLYDTRTDTNKAAARIRGWDKQTNKYVLESSLMRSTGAKGSSYGEFTLGTSVADTLVLQDCIYGKTCGSNSVAIFRRYPS
jgi:hypothetical protein